MANPDQPIKTCILKVNLKCCTGHQKKASMKLQSISGVNQVEYNSEKGLMTVTGDVEPLALVRKLTKLGKKTELLSVKYQLDDDDLNSDDEEDTSSDSTHSHPNPKTVQPEIPEKMKQKKYTGLLRKPSLLGCLSSKSKVFQPSPMRDKRWHVPSKFDRNGPLDNATTSSRYRPPYHTMPYQQMMPQQPPPGPPMMPQQPLSGPPMMRQQPPPGPPMMPQQPQAMTGAAMPYNVNMFPPEQKPYHMSKQVQTFKVNPKVHYQ